MFRLLKISTLGVLGGILLVGSSAFGQGYFNQPYYPGNPYVPTTVIASPPVIVVPGRTVLVIPRTGSNDYLYQYDNVYGSDASAAGRMSRTVVNPQPHFYIRGF